MKEQSIANDWRLQIHDELGSTSDLCAERARAGEPDGLAIVALRQTAGRGSHGRQWMTAEGNLAMSVLLRPAVPASEASRWSLIAGLAVIEALSDYADPDRLHLKWPNDVNLDAAKLAGVLIESAAGFEGGLDWLVIGIGANLAAAPVLPDRETACLAQFGSAPKPIGVAHAVLERLAHWRKCLVEEGFEPIRAAWLARAHPLGAPLLVTAAAGRQRGVFAGLTESGALLLASAGQIHQVSSAEVQQIPLAS